MLWLHPRMMLVLVLGRDGRAEGGERAAKGSGGRRPGHLRLLRLRNGHARGRQPKLETARGLA